MTALISNTRSSKLFRTILVWPVLTALIFLSACDKKEEATSQPATKKVTVARNQPGLQTGLIDYVPADALYYTSMPFAQLSQDLSALFATQMAQAVKSKSGLFASVDNANAPEAARVALGFIYLAAQIASSSALPSEQLTYVSFPKIDKTWSAKAAIVMTPPANTSVNDYYDSFSKILPSFGFIQKPNNAEPNKYIPAFSNAEGLELFLAKNDTVVQISGFVPTEVAPASNKLSDNSSYKSALAEAKTTSSEHLAMFIDIAAAVKNFGLEDKIRAEAAKAQSKDSEQALKFINSLEAGLLVMDLESPIDAQKSRLLITPTTQGKENLKQFDQLAKFSPDLSIDSKTIGMLSLNLDLLNLPMLNSLKQEATPALAMFPQLANLKVLSIKAGEQKTPAAAALAIPIPMPNIVAAIRFSDAQSGKTLLDGLKSMLPGLQCQASTDLKSRAVELCPTPMGFKLANRIDGNSIFLGTEEALKSDGADASAQAAPAGISSNVALVYMDNEKMAKAAKDALSQNPNVTPEVLAQFSNSPLKSSWSAVNIGSNGISVEVTAKFSADAPTSAEQK